MLLHLVLSPPLLADPQTHLLSHIISCIYKYVLFSTSETSYFIQSFISLLFFLTWARYLKIMLHPNICPMTLNSTSHYVPSLQRAET